MACNCCQGQGCFCKVADSTQESGFVIRDFLHNITDALFWIHRPYPVPMNACAYDNKTGLYLAPNAIKGIDENGCYVVFYQGDSHQIPYLYTRNGMPAISNASQNGFPSIIVEHFDGDYSFGGTIFDENFVWPELTVTMVEFKTEIDNVNKSCILYARSKTGLQYDNDTYIIEDPEEGWEIIDIISFNKPFLGRKSISLPFEFGGGVTGVEMIMQCSSFCNNLVNALLEFSGQASYYSNTMTLNQGYCTNMGAFNGTYNFKYINIPAGSEEACYGWRVKNFETFSAAAARVCANKLLYKPWHPGYDCTVEIAGIGTVDGLDPKFCFGKRYGIYTNFDGTQTVGEVFGFGGSSWFVADPYETNITSLDQTTYIGMWVNQPQNAEDIWDCSAIGCNIPVQRGQLQFFNTGSVTVTRI